MFLLVWLRKKKNGYKGLFSAAWDRFPPSVSDKEDTLGSIVLYKD